MRQLPLATLIIVAAVPAWAQTVTPLSTGNETASQGNAPVRKLLADGYDIKTAFSDNSGGAYMILQKATSAYMCHSGAAPTCEKLN